MSQYDDSGNGDTGSATATAPVARRDLRLGEELPVFCERCGYSLNGLTQIRCERCQVLHFACPECNHHQPINTLRPAVQRVLGRLRALGLALIVFLKINYFFWPLFAMGALGLELSYQYSYRYNAAGSSAYPVPELKFFPEAGLMLFILNCAGAMIGRMLLLRWRRGPLVGLALGGLVVAAFFIGAWLRYVDVQRGNSTPMQMTVGRAFVGYAACSFIGCVVGGVCAWFTWMALVTMLLPKRSAKALLEYQRAMSLPKGAIDRTDSTTSVTA